MQHESALVKRHSLLRLYHGSDITVGRPRVALNDGFADLGRGFYLTDSYEVARQRAMSRARVTASQHGIVSSYELDEGCVPWACWGIREPTLPEGMAADPFGLRFDKCRKGIAAWVEYIRLCRMGQTAVASLGNPAIIRGWIATEEVEMACAGLLSADDVADAVDPHELTVQYCLTDQAIINKHLVFLGAQNVD